MEAGPAIYSKSERKKGTTSRYTKTKIPIFRHKFVNYVCQLTFSSASTDNNQPQNSTGLPLHQSDSRHIYSQSGPAYPGKTPIIPATCHDPQSPPTLMQSHHSNIYNRLSSSTTGSSFERRHSLSGCVLQFFPIHIQAHAYNTCCIFSRSHHRSIAHYCPVSLPRTIEAKYHIVIRMHFLNQSWCSVPRVTLLRILST